MFESTGVINEDALEEFKKYIIPSIFRRIIMGLVIVCIMFAVISLLVSKFYVFVFLILSAIFAGEYFLMINISKKRCIKQIEETIGKREVKYKVYFDEEGVIVNNLGTNAKANMKYGVFKRVSETKNLYVMFTKGNQFVLIFKDCLDNNQKEEFEIFIKEKCRKIKFE